MLRPFCLGWGLAEFRSFKNLSDVSPLFCGSTVARSKRSPRHGLTVWWGRPLTHSLWEGMG